MCIYSKFWLEWERQNLAPYAVQSDHGWYARRGIEEQQDQPLDHYGSRSRYRTAFEIDKDRITNSQAFRRLEYKTQVFVTHQGDNYRTRLTHTLEVAEIALHIARALRLNEHLVEAIALGHDLGHAPYGHVAEVAINAWIKEKRCELKDDTFLENYYFCHNRHSVENVDHLEPGYDWDSRAMKDGFSQGMNLTNAVREGILAHTNRGFRGECHRKNSFDDDFEFAIRCLSDGNRSHGMYFPGSLEAQVVRIADDIAQRVHDLEDGLRSNILTKKDIQIALRKTFSILEQDIFEEDFLNKGTFDASGEIRHKRYGTTVSLVFLHHIVTMLRSAGDSFPHLVGFNYREPSEVDLLEIRRLLENDRAYERSLHLTALTAFLLHMWRSNEFLADLDDEARAMDRRRILKYSHLLHTILEEFPDETKQRGNNVAGSRPGDPAQQPQATPAYHFIAFLRGIMLANAIEHSFWNIHMNLDPEFRKFHRDYKKLDLPPEETGEHYYLAVILVDGFSETNTQQEVSFLSAQDPVLKGPAHGKSMVPKRYLFKFEDQGSMHTFIKKHHQEILNSNGRDTRAIQNSGDCRSIKKINWLNKSERPEDTGTIVITEMNGSSFSIPIKRIHICFTGYRELCPDGVACARCISIRNKNICPYRNDLITRPDINRLVDFQDHMKVLDKNLGEVIEHKIHHSSRVERMNYMGHKIVSFLLDEYFRHPWIMHDRVWCRLRTYPGWTEVGHNVREWIRQSITDRESLIMPSKAMHDLLEFNDKKIAQTHRYILARRVIEHIAGMTDRYIANEYNRLNQSGREVEIQDETYFFS